MLAEKGIVFRQSVPTTAICAAIDDLVEIGTRAECEECGNTGFTEVQLAPDDFRQQVCHCPHGRATYKPKSRNGIWA